MEQELAVTKEDILAELDKLPESEYPLAMYKIAFINGYYEFKEKHPVGNEETLYGDDGVKQANIIILDYDDFLHRIQVRLIQPSSLPRLDVLYVDHSDLQ